MALLLASIKETLRGLDDQDLFYPLIGIGIVLMFLLFAWNRWGPKGRRRRRGACLKCGFDLRGNPKAGCPECGWQREAAGPHSDSIS